jgi:pimeloyl-ACP methyl ester carboxylesterase
MPRVSSPARDLSVQSGDVLLAGTLWMPPVDPTAAVLMHPGSGPSDRHNDVFFPPIREHLLAEGIAVCSFDKRGVGGSTGSWREAAIEQQADDALAAVAALVSEEGVGVPVGLFGHSQGGWVVVEAASRGADVAFVMPNSGPGVTPGEQERYAARTRLEQDGADAAAIEEALESYDALVETLREGVSLADVRGRLAEADLEVPVNFELAAEADWELMRALVDYDPRPALERIDVPVLALFGADDPIVPVEASVAVYEEAVRPELLQVAVFPMADHRMMVGEPAHLAEGYLEALAAFVRTAAS